jgi:DNA-binding transcriptional regulator LsrR (DeoR family)
MDRGASRRDVALLRLVAQLYYERGLTQQDIAELTGFSVSKVSRLHREAREAGIVRITVESGDDDGNGLAARVSDALGVEIVVTPSNRSTVARAPQLCGAAAAPIVTDLLPNAGVVGWCAGRTLEALIRSMPNRSKPELLHVPVIGGGDSRNPHLDSSALVREVVDRIGGRFLPLYAPGILDSTSMRAALLAESHVARTVGLWADIELAVIGVSGPPEASASYFTVMDRVPPETRSDLTELGVVGDVIGHLYDIDGNVVPHDFTDRTLGMPLELIRKVPQVVAVLAGPTKVRSLIGLARTGLVHLVITDSMTAPATLDYLAGA